MSQQSMGCSSRFSEAMTSASEYSMPKDAARSHFLVNFFLVGVCSYFLFSLVVCFQLVQFCMVLLSVYASGFHHLIESLFSRNGHFNRKVCVLKLFFIGFGFTLCAGEMRF